MRRYLNIIKIACLLLALITVFAFAVTNLFVIISACGGVKDFAVAADNANYDHIVILGAGVKEDGELSNVLYDRVLYGAELYLSGAAKKIIVSGDGFGKYDESLKMREFLVAHGVNEADIISDKYGFNTYDTVWRAKNVYGAERVLIVTQDFHIYRSVFIAKAVGLDAEGVVCDTPHRATNVLYELRETAARSKYCLDAMFSHKANYTEK